MKPRSLSLIFATIASLGLMACASVAGAQDLTVDRIQFALDATDHRIELAQSVVATSTDARAQLELNAAVTLQAQAKDVFSQAQSASGDLQLRLFRQTVELTWSARGHADRAIAIVRGLPDPDRVRTQLDRTREIIERARDRIESCDNTRARAMLHAAVEMQTRADAAAGDLRFLAALQLTMSARERVLKALRLCNADENLSDSAERALKRTDEIIARAEEIVTEKGSEQAREALSRAVQLESRATDEFRLEHFEASLRLTQAARAAAYRAIRMSGGL